MLVHDEADGRTSCLINILEHASSNDLVLRRIESCLASLVHCKLGALGCGQGDAVKLNILDEVGS